MYIRARVVAPDSTGRWRLVIFPFLFEDSFAWLHVGYIHFPLLFEDFLTWLHDGTHDILEGLTSLNLSCAVAVAVVGSSISSW